MEGVALSPVDIAEDFAGGSARAWPDRDFVAARAREKLRCLILDADMVPE